MEVMVLQSQLQALQTYTPKAQSRGVFSPNLLAAAVVMVQVLVVSLVLLVAVVKRVMAVL